MMKTASRMAALCAVTMLPTPTRAEENSPQLREEMPLQEESTESGAASRQLEDTYSFNGVNYGSNRAAAFAAAGGNPGGAVGGYGYPAQPMIQQNAYEQQWGLMGQQQVQHQWAQPQPQWGQVFDPYAQMGQIGFGAGFGAVQQGFGAGFGAVQQPVHFAAAPAVAAAPAGGCST